MRRHFATAPSTRSVVCTEPRRIRRAARQLRDMLRERLCGELDPLRECQARIEGRGDVDREPELDREAWLVIISPAPAAASRTTQRPLGPTSAWRGAWPITSCGLFQRDRFSGRYRIRSA